MSPAAIFDRPEGEVRFYNDHSELVEPSKKSVSFEPWVNFRMIQPLGEYTEDEIRSIWYDVEEYQQIKQNCKLTLKLVARGKKIWDNDEDYCIRGLEYRSKDGHKNRLRNKEAVWYAVFREQETQEPKDVFDDFRIGQASCETTLPARMHARVAGLEDQKKSGA